MNIVSYGNGIEVCRTFHENGNVKTEQWFYNGEFHNSHGPAEIKYYKNGQKKIEVWYINGKCHREGRLPAMIEYYKNGTKLSESWYIDGNLQTSEMSPSSVIYYSDGRKRIESWSKKLSEDPIVIYYNRGILI